MKSSLIFFLISCISINNCLTQGTFELIISNPSHQHIMDCEEDQDGNIYIVGENVYVENSQVTSICGTIYKIDPSGNILQEMEYCYPDSVLSFFEVGILGDSLYVLGTSGPVGNGWPDLFEIFVMDRELNEIDHSRRRLFEDATLGGMKHMIHPSGDIIVLGAALNQENIVTSDVYFYRFTKDLDSVQCSRDARDGEQSGLDFLLDPDDGGYRVFGLGHYPGSPSSYSKLVRYDSSFNFLGVDSLAWNIGGHHTVTWFIDSTYLVTGRKNFWSPFNPDMAIIKLNSMDKLVETRSFGRPADTADYAGVKDNIDFVTKDNIYFGGTSNFIVNQWPWQTDDSWINLVNLDSNLNVNWQRYYGGDAFYTLYGLKATQDGGCFMYSTRYDENTQFQEYDVYILKVDSNGLLTSVSDIPNIAANELFIYPNPANEKITVQFPGVTHFRQKELCIYNNLGSIVWQREIPDRQDRMSVNISHLPAGLYHAVIRSHRERVASGKLLIAR